MIKVEDEFSEMIHLASERLKDNAPKKENLGVPRLLPTTRRAV